MFNNSHNVYSATGAALQAALKLIVSTCRHLTHYSGLMASVLVSDQAVVFFFVFFLFLLFYDYYQAVLGPILAGDIVTHMLICDSYAHM